MQERDINIKGLIVEILLRWRSIIVVMLAGAVLMGGFSFWQSYRTSKAQEKKVETAKEQLEKMNTEGAKEWLEENMTETQIYNVNFVLAYEQLYRDKVAYTQQSLVMQMDPNNVYRGEITFFVSSDDMEKTYNIEKVYEDFLRGGELFADIANELNMTEANVNEIIALERESYEQLSGMDTIRVRVIHDEEAVCEKVIQLIIECVQEKNAELSQSLGVHEIAVLSRSVIAVTDTDILDEQKKYFSDIVVLEYNISDRKADFTTMEWQYYDILLNGQITELSTSNRDPEEDESPMDIVNKGVTVSPGVSLKYVIFGMALAGAAYVFVLFMMYITNNKIRYTDDLQSLYLIPQLGLIPQKNNNKRFLGFLDEWLISFRDRDKRKFAEEEALKLAAVAIKMAVGKEALDTVYLIGCDIKEHSLQVCEQLKKVLVQDNIRVEILNNVLYDAQTMSELEAAEGVVIVEKAGSTLYSEIEQELELLKRLSIKLLGAVVAE